MIEKHIDTTWKTRTLRSGKQRTKKCAECNKLFRAGDRVHGEFQIREQIAEITGNFYKAGHWYFWHIEHDRHEDMLHWERCCEGYLSADQIAKDAGYESHEDFVEQMRKETGLELPNLHQY